MGLKESLEANKGSLKGPRCTVCTLIQKLDKSDSAALVAALEDETFTHAAIYRALQAEGHRISATTVQRHRTRNCVRI